MTEEKITAMVDCFGASWRAQAILENMLVDMLIHKDMYERSAEFRVREMAKALEATYERRLERMAATD